MRCSTCAPSSVRSCVGGCSMGTRATGRRVMWALIAAVLALLYLPLAPPLLFSVSGESGLLHDLTLRWDGERPQHPLLVGAIRISLLEDALTGLVNRPPAHPA